MLNDSTVCSLDCTAGYDHIFLSPKAQNRSAFVTPIGKFKFNKVPFGSVQSSAYIQQFINEVIKVLSFTFGYLYDILIFVQMLMSTSNTEELWLTD